MSLYTQFETNTVVEKEGIVLEYGLNSKQKTMGIRIARAGGSNSAYSKQLEAKIKPYRRQIQNETMDNDVAEKITKEVYFNTVVLGWENIEDRAGVAMEFNKANFMQLMTDLPDLWSDIQTQASRAALFRAEILEADAKN